MIPNDYKRTTIDELKACFQPLPRDIHKGDNGRAGVIGGSYNFVGAPVLAALGLAAMRVGAGLTYVGFPDCLYGAVSARVTESILVPFKMDGKVIAADADALSVLSKCNAVAVGMGLGKTPHFNEIATLLLKNEQLKLLIDADGLNNLDISLLEDFGERIIITPHAMEFSRLSGTDLDDIKKAPVEAAVAFSKRYKAVTLLKGAETVITDGERVTINAFGTPAQAKGGSGDLLSGIICGLLARGFDTFTSAYVGAGVAGISAELAAEALTEFSTLPTDVLRYIPKAVGKIIGA